MFDLFNSVLSLLKVITKIKNANFYDDGLASFDVEKDGETYCVTMRKVEKKDA